MSKESLLENIIMDTMVDYISERVVEKLIQKSKKGLLLFTGATLGYNDAIKSINELRLSGWEFDIVMSSSAQNVIGVDKVKNDINVENIIINEDLSIIKELLSKNNVVIIPTLTMNSASKIANCISDTLITNIVSKALMSGKKVVASINGCCPENEERISIYGDNLTPAHKMRLSQNLETLRSYNIKLSYSKSLYKNVNEILLKSFNINKENVKKETLQKIDKPKNLESLSFTKINKKVISRKDIWDNKNFNTIIINSNTLITDLAREEALKLNIKLLKDEG